MPEQPRAHAAPRVERAEPRLETFAARRCISDGAVSRDHPACPRLVSANGSRVRVCKGDEAARAQHVPGQAPSAGGWPGKKRQKVVFARSL